ncbi:MAG TPA: 5-methyltetrahydropteroyltriglutamate--homocysteine S-methyltransferase [Candidatus Binataceae bacterium]|nr:5-methyltetrahydropteroyltriglutamate--homocysteine S-methyltransferase [Candidatus Binataceae bacterium]
MSEPSQQKGSGGRPQIPAHADHVGSLLRPAELKEARENAESGATSASELKAIEDRCIAGAIDSQIGAGLRTVTDGEFRRAYWHLDFLGALEGLSLTREQAMIPGTATRNAGFVHRHRLQVTGRVAWQAPHPFVDHFRFVAAHAGAAMAKQTIPSPAFLHFRFGPQAVEAAGYRDMDTFLADIAAAYADAVRAFAAAGCRYLQLDETTLAMLCDPAQVEQAKQRGVFRDDLARDYARTINAALRGRPADMIAAMHLCRGNFRSTWVASGGYESIADLLFNDIDVDAYFLEYDSERAGGFEPLRYLPKGKTVVLGLVTTKAGAMERRDDLRRLIDAAAKYAPLEQLAISPQCGFASTEEGNTITEEQQWAKLRLCVEVAREVWGGSAA